MTLVAMREHRVFCDNQNNKFGFQLYMKQKRLISRGMLASLISVFCNQCIQLLFCSYSYSAATFILNGKQIIQKLCHQSLNGDEKVPESYEWV